MGMLDAAALGDSVLSRVAGLLLAAGPGRRIGGPKALLRQGDTLLVERALAVLREAGCQPVVVVLGAGADRVQATADLGDALVLVNPGWGSGVGSSLRVGLAALADSDVEAALVVPVDMPGIGVAAVERVAALPYPDVLVCASYNGRREYPMLLGRRHWAGISTLANADVGARPYLLAHRDDVLYVACDNVADEADIDTPEDATRWGITLPAQRQPSQ